MIQIILNVFFRQPSQDGPIHEIIISEVSKELSGTIDLICSNRYGMMVSTCDVLVLDDPILPVVAAERTSPGESSVIRELVQPQENFKRFQSPNLANQNSGSVRSMNSSRCLSKQCSPLKDTDLKAPIFMTIFTDIKASAGESVQLKCHVSGCPVPAVSLVCDLTLFSRSAFNDFLLCFNESIHGNC